MCTNLCTALFCCTPMFSIVYLFVYHCVLLMGFCAELCTIPCYQGLLSHHRLTCTLTGVHLIFNIKQCLQMWDLHVQQLKALQLLLIDIVVGPRFICVPLCTIEYHCVPLCTTVYHCVPLCTFVYYCVLLSAIVYCCVLLCTVMYHWVPLSTTAFHLQAHSLTVSEDMSSASHIGEPHGTVTCSGSLPWWFFLSRQQGWQLEPSSAAP